ncbi:MAG: hypothetical protein R3D55_01360 [Chloroflexota bacterium]
MSDLPVVQDGRFFFGLRSGGIIGELPFPTATLPSHSSWPKRLGFGQS